MEHSSIAGWWANWGFHLRCLGKQADLLRLKISFRLLPLKPFVFGAVHISIALNISNLSHIIRYLEVFIVSPCLRRPRNALASFSCRAPCHFGELKPFWDPWPTDSKGLGQVSAVWSCPGPGALSMLKLDTRSTSTYLVLHQINMD